MKTNIDPSVCVFGAAAMMNQIAALKQESEGVRLGKDIECVHRMRVASRRLRAILPLFSGCFSAKKYDIWEKQVKRITGSLGEARDKDVQIELLTGFLKKLPSPAYRTGIRRLLLRLAQKRQKLQAKVLAALDDLEKNQTLEQIEQAAGPMAAQEGEIYLFTPALYRLAFDSIQQKLDDFLSYDDVVNQPERVDELHAMRIAAKRLRYTLEIFSSLYPDQLKSTIQIMRKMQDGLGSIHDCDVWVLYLPEFLDEERALTIKYFGHARVMPRIETGIRYFSEDRQAERNKEYEDFVRDWEKWTSQDVWGQLRKTIHQPFFVRDQAELYPAAPTQSKKEPTA